MTLAEYGVDPDEPDVDEPRYEFEAESSDWSLVAAAIDESVTPAKTRCPGCGQNLGPLDPVLLDYGRDVLCLACRICEGCQNIIPTHTATSPDELEHEWALGYPYSRLPHYKRERVLDDEYPNFGLYQLDLDGELPEVDPSAGGEQA